MVKFPSFPSVFNRCLRACMTLFLCCSPTRGLCLPMLPCSLCLLLPPFVRLQYTGLCHATPRFLPKSTPYSPSVCISVTPCPNVRIIILHSTRDVISLSFTAASGQPRPDYTLSCACAVTMPHSLVTFLTPCRHICERN